MRTIESRAIGLGGLAMSAAGVTTAILIGEVARNSFDPNAVSQLTEMAVGGMTLFCGTVCLSAALSFGRSADSDQAEFFAQTRGQ